MVKTRVWIIVIAAILLLSAAALVYVNAQRPAGHIAKVYVDGEVVLTVDLDAVTAPEEHTFYYNEGWNTVTVEPGRICVSEADCPDGVCVDTGWLPGAARPIVCLPHHLVIELTDADDAIDAVSQ